MDKNTQRENEKRKVGRPKLTSESKKMVHSVRLKESEANLIKEHYGSLTALIAAALNSIQRKEP